jgi:hypothetical protein
MKELIVGCLLVVVGVVFLFSWREMTGGAFRFYRTLYTERNLGVMFRAAGIVLIVGGVVLVLTRLY